MSKKNPFGNLSPAEKELTNMKYRDLKIACIVRGMLFEDIVEGTYPSLSSYFVKKYDTNQDRSLLEQFDEWMVEQLTNRGHAKDSPLVQFRLSTTSDENEDVKLKTKSFKNAQVKKEKKPKRERDKSFGIFKGTKKALTYKLTTEGVSILETIQKVLAKFPEAQEKSIKIWAKRCLKENKK